MKHLLSVCDTQDQVVQLLDLAAWFKKGKSDDKPLKNKTLAMIFQKSSTRTRVSFEVGMAQLGGHALYLSTNDLQIGRGEPISDTARALSRYVDGIMIRALKHEDVVELSENASVPVINGLTDLEHPCQVLADMQTIKEHKGSFEGKLVFVGDGNNVCNSLLLISAILGMNMTVACPEGYEPDAEIFEKAQGLAKESGAVLEIIYDIKKAVKNADILYTDVWVSMGDEKEQEQRINDFMPFQVNEELMSRANEGAIFMHCLPAIRGQETTAGVIDGPQSVVWDQAENRLHAQKAVMYSLMKD
ncbi:MAG: ornithine carbamoyltransferase [Methanobacteriaceae archaeon]|nr:ornithine carbamoyltransferase [Methanobacteriaceae archaeon]MDP2836421.1 ornithine carbamoyltransferase [Methanobacteriaceae archaeon]MDP3035399.1 ornithine carbamoyltransferase [Methanobacteriaceae archaeon]MDP3484795.1 ornithine carbamoyltransferase [Methanobacteriaceae archaeon]MDP3623513.1 ornithine carbamoyltransferase [Methanobacteriaceae archaeon]